VTHSTISRALTELKDAEKGEERGERELKPGSRRCHYAGVGEELRW